MLHTRPRAPNSFFSSTSATPYPSFVVCCLRERTRGCLTPVAASDLSGPDSSPAPTHRSSAVDAGREYRALAAAADLEDSSRSARPRTLVFPRPAANRSELPERRLAPPTPWH